MVSVVSGLGTVSTKVDAQEQEPPVALYSRYEVLPEYEVSKMAMTALEQRSLEMLKKAQTDEEILQAVMMEADEEEEPLTDEEAPSRMELNLMLSSNPDT
jgi:hypothetical protein